MVTMAYQELRRNFGVFPSYMMMLWVENIEKVFRKINSN
jgi:hypothetical protein